MPPEMQVKLVRLWSTVQPTIDGNKIERGIHRGGSLIGIKQLQIRNVRILFLISSDTDLIAIMSGRSIADSVVQLFQAGNSQNIITTGVNSHAVRKMNCGFSMFYCASRAFFDGRGPAERCRLLLEAAEDSSWLNKIYVIVEILWQTVGESSDVCIAAFFMPPYMVSLINNENID